MIVAVLNNRLLQLTNRSFRNEEFGASSLLELVSRHCDLVAVDRTVKPIAIEWIGPPPTVRADAHVGRVRPDLWLAVLDYSSGLQYEWDIDVQQARAVQAAVPQLRLPTVDAVMLASWREAFVKVHEATPSAPEDRQRLREWATRALGSQGLPRALRAPWNEYLKRAVVARLTCWFKASGQPMPEIV
jgi:hypothetical protein